MSVLNDIRLVDIDGFDIPITEKNGIPHDPTDPTTWPAWTDNWFWAENHPNSEDLNDLDRWLESIDSMPDDQPAEPSRYTAAEFERIGRISQS